MSFRVVATDGAARAGVLVTSRGEIRTPAFMPVGTKGTVKSLHPDEVRALGADVVLANTYHLHFRPGEKTVEELGGIHAFSGWAGPILTDSGGFQVFSLRDTIAARDAARSERPSISWSSCMMTSAPRLRSMRMTLSAVKRRLEPSTWLRKSTPSSSIVRSPSRENT